MITTQVLLKDATAVGAGQAMQLQRGRNTFQATLAGTGTATVIIEVTSVEVPVDSDWLEMGTRDLSTTARTKGFAGFAGWPKVRARISAVTGSPTVNVYRNLEVLG